MLVRWRHPEKTIEFLVALFHEWMGTFEINWLARQQTDGICIGSSYFVMRKVRMKVEGGNTLEQAELVQVSIGCHRHQIVGSFNGCGAEPVFVHHRHTESFHQRARILSKPLLPGDERITMVPVVQLPPLQSGGNTHILIPR